MALDYFDALVNKTLAGADEPKPEDEDYFDQLVNKTLSSQPQEEPLEDPTPPEDPLPAPAPPEDPDEHVPAGDSELTAAAREEADPTPEQTPEEKRALANQFTEGIKDVKRQSALGIGLSLTGDTKQLKDASALIDDEDLLELINESRISGVSLDQLKQELINAENWKADHPNFVERGTKKVGEEFMTISKDISLQSYEDMQPKTFIDKLFRTIPQVVAQIAVGMATGGVGSTAFMGAQILGASYENLIAQGVPHDRAMASALANAVIQAPMEAIGIGKVTKLLKMRGVIARKLKHFGEAMGKEGLTEFFQQFPEVATEIWAKDPDAEVLQSFADSLTSETFMEALEAGALGAILGAFGGGGAILTRTTINDQILGSNPLVEETDFNKPDPSAAPATALASGMNATETNEAHGKIVEAEQNRKALAEQRAAQKEQLDKRDAEKQQQDQAQAQAAAEEQKAQIAKAETQYAQGLSDPAVLMSEAAELDAKPINEAHKALSIEEDSITKLRGLSYDLRQDKDLKEQPFEFQAVAQELAGRVDQRVAQLMGAESQAEFEKLQAEGGKIENKEAEKAEKEREQAEQKRSKEAAAKKTKKATVTPKPTKDPFNIFVEDTIAAAKERKAEEAAEAAAKPKLQREPTFDYKAKKKRERVEAATRVRAAQAKLRKASPQPVPKGPATGRAVPKDLKAAIQLEDGQVILGDNHFDILGSMSDTQLEKLDLTKLRRGFYTRDDGGFFTSDDSQKRYGIRKTIELGDDAITMEDGVADIKVKKDKVLIKEGIRMVANTRRKENPYAELTARVQKATGVKIVVAKNKKAHRPLATHFRESNRIEIYPENFPAKTTQEKVDLSVAHEVIHNILTKGIRKNPLRLKLYESEMKKFIGSLKKYRQYSDSKNITRILDLAGKPDKMDEVVTYGMTHPEFSAWLNSLPIEGEKGAGGKTLWSWFKGIITKHVNFMAKTKLDQLNDILDSVLPIKGPQGAKYQRGPGDVAAPAAQRGEFLDQLIKDTEERLEQKSKKLNLGKIKLVRTTEDLPAEAKARGAAATSRGVYLPSEDVSYIVMDQHNDLVEVLGTIWHELGHQKLAALATRAELGDDYSRLLEPVIKSHPVEVAAFQEKWGVDQQEAAEEILVRKFEKGPTLKAKVKAFLSKLANAIGMNPNMTETELTGILRTMRKDVSKPVAWSTDSTKVRSMLAAKFARNEEGGKGSALGDTMKWNIEDLINKAGGIEKVGAYLQKKNKYLGRVITLEAITYGQTLANNMSDPAARARRKEIVSIRNRMARGTLREGTAAYTKAMKKYGPDIEGHTIRHVTRYHATKDQIFGPAKATDKPVKKQKKHILRGAFEHTYYYDDNGDLVMDTPILSALPDERATQIDAIVAENKQHIDWYERWNDFMFNSWGKEIEPELITQFVKVQAVLSAGTGPQTNQKLFTKVIKILESGRDLKPGKVKDGNDGVSEEDAVKIHAIWNNADPATDFDSRRAEYGQKVGAYMTAGLDPKHPLAIVIDRHMPRLWGFDITWSGNGNHKNFIVKPIVEEMIVADILASSARTGISPAGVQAALWFKARLPDTEASSYREAARIKPSEYLPGVLYDQTVPAFLGTGVHYSNITLNKGEFLRGSDRDPISLTPSNTYSRDDVGNRKDRHTQKNPYAELVYFYESGTFPEPQLAGKRNVYTVDLDRMKIYDAIRDPLNYNAEVRKIMKADPGAHETNILSNLLKQANYDGFLVNNPLGKGRWILMNEQVAIANAPVTVQVGISDVVEKIENLPQDIKELERIMGERGAAFLKRIKAIKNANYPDVNIESFDPAIAQFAGATSDQREIGASLKLTGPLNAVRSMASQIAIENSQRWVYLMHAEGKPTGSTVIMKVKPEIKTAEEVKDILAKYDIAEYNIVVKQATGSIFIEQYIYAPAELEKFGRAKAELEHRGFPGNAVHDTVSEMHGDDKMELSPDILGKNITDYFGEENGKIKLEEALGQRELYQRELYGKSGKDPRIQGPKFARGLVKGGVQEIIESPAISYKGVVYTGITHSEAIIDAEASLGEEINVADTSFEGTGFSTSTGRYVNREEGMKIARAADQLDDPANIQDELGAEDLRDVAEELGIAKTPQERSEAADKTIAKSAAQSIQEEAGVQPAPTGGAISAEQRAWFGDSKVVDENGQPLVVYHGTWGTFDTFNISRSEFGAHFGTARQSNLSNDLRERGIGQRMLPVYLKITNPIRLKDMGQFAPRGYLNQPALMTAIGEKKARELDEADILGKKTSREIDAEVRDLLLKNGYDGIVYLNRREGLDERELDSAVRDEFTQEATDKDFKEEFPNAEDSWIALKPNQIKSVFTKKPTAASPKFAYEPAFAISDVVADKDSMERSWLAEKNRLWTDQLSILDELEKGKDIDAIMSGRVSHTLISNAPAMIETNLQYGNIKMSENWMEVEKKGRGIIPIVKELGDQAVPFFDRLTAKSGQELINDYGRQNLWGSDENGQIDDQGKIDEIMTNTEKIYEANKESWNAIELELREINKQILDFMVEAGILRPEQRDKMRKTYIPFFRQVEDFYNEELETLLPHSGKGIGTTHRLKGSEIHQLGDPIANLISGYSFFINESLRNLARKKSLKIAKEAGLLRRVHRGQKNSKGVIQIRQDGESLFYKVLDPILFDTLTTFQQSKVDTMSWLRPWSAAKRLITWGVTVMPRFRQFNILRDTMSAAFMNKNFIPFLDTYKGLMHGIRVSPEWITWSSAGGNFQGSYSKRDVQVSTAKGIGKLHKKLLPNQSNSFVRFLKGASAVWERIGELSEGANRMGIFLRERQKGSSVAKAAFESRDLLDFHRKGAGSAAQILISTVPFLNARIQGLSKMARSMKDPGVRKRFWLAASMMTAASMVLHYANQDDEDYQQLSDWEKIAYWHIYIGEGDRKQHFRIPTPFEVGSIFGAIPSAIWETVRGDRTIGEMAKFGISVLANTFSFNPIPQLARPIVEQIAGYDFYTMQPIESLRDKRTTPELRVARSSSHFAKELSKTLRVVSPKRIDKIMRDYFGSSAHAATATLDLALQYLDPVVDPAGTQLDKLLYVSGLEGFYPSVKTADVPGYTKYTDAYYELAAEASQAYTAMLYYRDTATGEEYEAMQTRYAERIQIYHALAPFQQRLQRVNTEKNLVRQSRAKSAKQKRHELNMLLAKRNKIYMQAVKEARRVAKLEKEKND